MGQGKYLSSIESINDWEGGSTRRISDLSDPKIFFKTSTFDDKEADP